MKPVLLVIAGPNASGKATVWRCGCEPIDGDQVAARRLPVVRVQAHA
jgi:predicted ABC-type ATPase